MLMSLAEASTPGRMAIATNVVLSRKGTQGGSAARQRISLHHSLIICQEVIINALQGLPALLVPC